MCARSRPPTCEPPREPEGERGFTAFLRGDISPVKSGTDAETLCWSGRMPLLLYASALNATYASAPRAAPHGNVVSHAARIVPTIFQCAFRFTVPIPNSAPQLTCVVETG